MNSTVHNALLAILQTPSTTPRARIDRPETDEYAEYYGRYISLAPAGDFLEGLRSQAERMVETFGGLTDQQGAFAYAPGKWSIAEVLGHLADTERLFGFRALHMARGDASPLPGMEQDEWMQGAEFAGRSAAELLRDWLVVRAGTIAFAEGLPAAAPTRTGIASERRFSVRALLHAIPGHVEYHLAIHRERYLADPRWPR